MQGKKHLYGGALALLLATVLLAGCGIDGTANATPSPTASAPPSPTATATSQPSPTPTTIIHGDWQTYTDTKYGFSLDVPAILSLAPTGTSGDAVGLYWAYTVKSPPPQGQAVFAETMIDVYATDTLTGGNPNPCTIGTPVTIGSGVRAYEADTIGVTSKGGGTAAQGGWLLMWQPAESISRSSSMRIQGLLSALAPSERATAPSGSTSSTLLSLVPPCPMGTRAASLGAR